MQTRGRRGDRKGRGGRYGVKPQRSTLEKKILVSPSMMEHIAGLETRFKRTKKNNCSTICQPNDSPPNWNNEGTSLLPGPMTISGGFPDTCYTNCKTSQCRKKHFCWSCGEHMTNKMCGLQSSDGKQCVHGTGGNDPRHTCHNPECRDVRYIVLNDEKYYYLAWVTAKHNNLKVTWSSMKVSDVVLLPEDAKKKAAAEKMFADEKADCDITMALYEYRCMKNAEKKVAAEKKVTCEHYLLVDQIYNILLKIFPSPLAHNSTTVIIRGKDAKELTRLLNNMDRFNKTVSDTINDITSKRNILLGMCADMLSEAFKPLWYETTVSLFDVTKEYFIKRLLKCFNELPMNKLDNAVRYQERFDEYLRWALQNVINDVMDSKKRFGELYYNCLGYEIDKISQTDRIKRLRKLFKGDLIGKIVGMFLEMDIVECFMLTANKTMWDDSINEALEVLVKSLADNPE